MFNDGDEYDLLDHPEPAEPAWPSQWQRIRQAPGRVWGDIRWWWRVRSGRITFDDDGPF